jgi:copper homeostasis protein (lipoprotein)
MKFTKYIIFSFLIAVAAVGCDSRPKEDGASNHITQIKGLYSFGPEMKSFTDCEEGQEYWVTDSAKTLELAYSNFNFEKPYEPVYIEAEGYLTLSDSLSISASFDSTFVVTKLLKITKEIPEGPCNQ